MEKCSFCGQTEINNYIHDVDRGRQVCEDCKEEDFIQCECGKYKYDLGDGEPCDDCKEGFSSE